MPQFNEDSKFEGAPKMRLGMLVQAMALPDGTVGAVDADGVPAVIQTADFLARTYPIRTETERDGIFCLMPSGENGAPRRFLFSAKDREVLVEGFDTPLPITDFRAMGVRCTDDGTPLCALAEPMHMQVQKCREAGIAGRDHLDDIRFMAEALGESGEKADLYDHHMVRLTTSVEETGTDYLEALAKTSRPGHAEGPVHDRFGLGVAVDGWHEVRQLPTYMQTGVRMAFEIFMRDLLGEFPDDRVSMVSYPHGEQLSEALEEAGFALEGMLKPFENRNLLPGYKTGDVALHRANGVDVVVFSDFLGTYAYAWPTDEGGKYQIERADALRFF